MPAIGMDYPNISQSNTSDAEVPHQASPPVKSIVIICYACLSGILGTSGNLLVICSVLLSNHLRTISNCFVANLAFADLLVAVSVFPSLVILAVKGPSAIPAWICSLVGVLLAYSCVASLMNMMLVAVDRYFAVCRKQWHRRIFHQESLIFLLLFSWLEPLCVLVLPYLFGVGRYAYDDNAELCTIRFPHYQVWFGYYVAIVCVFLPMSITIGCYYKIFWTFRTSKKRVNVNGRQPLRKPDLDVYRSLFVVFILLVVLWTPYGFGILLNAISPYRQLLPEQYFRISTYLVVTNSAVNCVVYGLTNSNFAEVYRGFFRGIWNGVFSVLRIRSARKYSPDETTDLNHDTTMTVSFI